MKKSYVVATSIVLMFCLLMPVSAVELDDVYRQMGDYNVVASGGVRLYYPDSARESIARIISQLVRVRQNLVNHFPDQAGFEATVILNDHDDRISSSTEDEFDWINLGMFEEIGALSTRAYSLEKRFAMRLAHVMLLRTLAASTNSWRRQLAVLAVPQWFLDGLGLKYAFPLDSVHFSRLLDMARNDRLYSLDQLNTILSQPTLVREEMRFQAHSMFEFWDQKYKKDAAISLMKSIFKKPADFRNLFRRHYGVSLNEAYNAYLDYVCEKCDDFKVESLKQDVQISNTDIGGGFFRSFRRLGPDESVWVSSRRYSTETYDLYYRSADRRPVILLKNVHPLLMVDEHSRSIIIGKYRVNSKRQRRLSLWMVSVDGKSRCLVDEPGSFKPLGKRFGRVFYTSIRGGITRVMSVDPEFKNSKQVEYTFPAALKPLDLALHKNCRELFYTFEKNDFRKSLAGISIVKDDRNKAPLEIYSSEGDIGSLAFAENMIWFAARKDFYTPQLFSLSPHNAVVKKHTSLPGGVWDVSFSDDSIDLITLNKGEFWSTSISARETPLEVADLPAPEMISMPELRPVKSTRYRSEFNSSYWKPLFSEDDQGRVFGVYSYRTDRLGRSSIVVAPTYGIKSQDAGYLAQYMQRFGLFKFTARIEDQVKENAYLDSDYFERTRSKTLDVTYPLSLSTTIGIGMDLTDRKIAKIKQVGKPLPTVGRDHSLYANVKHLAIRTEPYWKVFPRKGRRAELMYKKGEKLFDGQLLYDSVSLRWEEYIPLNDCWVLTARTWMAEDDKKNNIRRPDDLSLGGRDYMRAYASAFRSGDSLRTMSFHLGRPVKFIFPRFMSWIYNEFMVAEIFWEAGDAKKQGRYDWQFDRGLEIRSQLLMFKRIPVIVRMGVAKQNTTGRTDNYIAVDFSDLSEVFQ